MDWLTPERYAAAIRSETARFAAALVRRDDAEQIVTCPEWTVRDLATHVGTGHRLAAGIIEERRDSMAEYVLVDAPPEQPDWPEWLDEGVTRLNAAVDDLGFHGRVWTWMPQHQIAGFWQRRMLHDLIVHRFDADPDGRIADLDIDLAADGVADMLLTLEYFKRPTGTGETVQFQATDTGQGWHVTLHPGGISWRPETAPADVTIEAPVKDLLLIINRRRVPEMIEGNAALYDHWRTNTQF
ncbi:maleylpyruvate isomerase family mycothiol-dependent enzyme [Actinoplanes sp. CA-030573]|uniref:maleylpyruvate isomerase family mycothiol-dependent enzyme n=1 Tax=Actinoplanes sp. CA-030573 TaxID=3239898 RepID=UPI003D93B360